MQKKKTPDNSERNAQSIGHITVRTETNTTVEELFY